MPLVLFFVRSKKQTTLAPISPDHRASGHFFLPLRDAKSSVVVTNFVPSTRATASSSPPARRTPTASMTSRA